MKILLIGAAGKPNRTEYYIRRAFERAGHRTSWFDNNRWRSMPKAAIGMLLRLVVHVKRPGFVLVTKGRHLEPAALKRALRRTRSAMWYFDAHEKPPESVLRLAAAVDTLFLTNRGQMQPYRDAGAKSILFLPQGCDSEAHVPVREDCEERYQVSFVGNALSSPYRAGLLAELSEHFEVHLWGQRNTEPCGNCIAHATHTANRELARVIRQSGVVIGCNAFESLNVLESYASNRVWLTLGCGGFFLGHRNPGMDTVVPTGEYCDSYGSVRELIEKTHYYLERPALRYKMRDAAAAWVHGGHTFEHRIRNLLATREYDLSDTGGGA